MERSCLGCVATVVQSPLFFFVSTFPLGFLRNWYKLFNWVNFFFLLRFVVLFFYRTLKYSSRIEEPEVQIYLLIYFWTNIFF